MTDRLFRRFLIGVTACLVASAPSLFAANVCLLQEAPFLAKSQPVYEDVLSAGWELNIYGTGASTALATPTGHNGLFALEVNFQGNWKSLGLQRSFPLPTAGLRALVFRVRGITNNDLGQVWLTLTAIGGQWIASVPVTDHMVTTPNGTYDPTTWYTVVIPMDALNPNGLYVTGLSIMTGTLSRIYLDDMWLVAGLEFPLAGQTASTASITSVFDHTMTDGHGNIAKWPAVDGVVTAYTGEVANGAAHADDSTCITGSDAPYNTVMTNYTGAGSCDGISFLSYDNHPAIDYHADQGAEIRAPADGKVTVSDCKGISTGQTCVGQGTGWGKLVIDLVGPYTVSFNHLSYVRDGLGVGTTVRAGEVVGYVGHTTPPAYSFAPHLHIGVLLDYGAEMYVDPYGWTGNYADPYRVKAVNVRLWK